MTYLILKTLHIVSFTAWMAGLFYLPRLYVYHAAANTGSESSEIFKIMERKLLRFIMNPAMIATFIFGISMIVYDPALMKQGWLHVKFLLVFGMAGFHGFLASARRAFAEDRNTRPERFYRLVNEVPTILLLGIVFLAVVKPF